MKAFIDQNFFEISPPWLPLPVGNTRLLRHIAPGPEPVFIVTPSAVLLVSTQ